MTDLAETLLTTLMEAEATSSLDEIVDALSETWGFYLGKTAFELGDTTEVLDRFEKAQMRGYLRFKVKFTEEIINASGGPQ